MRTYIKTDYEGYALFINSELPLNQRTLDKIYVDDEDEEISDEYVLAYEDGGFWHPRWNGEEWVEGATQEEIDELNINEPSEMNLLGQEVVSLKIANMQKDNIINILGQEIVNIKLLQGGM